ncbi:hypothetical protein RIF29_42485 [Crotalaria pallida]|uniref:Uncharacterized protein n=1 Tax=Crotalaria pallida TaxID=3830 RepID=A0AAN9E7E2_CROPI
MPVSDPSSGRRFIWLVTCLLLISILAGGACLVAYMVLPESETSSWISIIGVTLVCLPWAFWFLTFLYRVISRCCGLRVGGGYGANGGGGRSVGGGGIASRNADVEGAGQSSKGSDINRECSVNSHESEMPLARSMAS